MNISDHKHDFDKVIDFLKSDIAGLRTGRASAIIVENVFVEAYGSKQSLKAVASITIPDAKTINIEPWDKSLLGAVEKGVRDSGAGLNPTNDGHLVRLFLPELTSERRQELIKVLHQKLENTRISVRKTREEVKAIIAMAEKSDEIREDEKFKLQEDLEKMVKEYNDKIKMIGDEKEKEINVI